MGKTQPGERKIRDYFKSVLEGGFCLNLFLDTDSVCFLKMYAVDKERSDCHTGFVYLESNLGYFLSPSKPMVLVLALTIGEIWSLGARNILARFLAIICGT